MITSPVWVDVDNTGEWYGQYVTLSDTSLEREAIGQMLECYQQTVKALEACYTFPIGQVELISRFNQQGLLDVGWKQQFRKASEFSIWLEKFKQEHSNVV